MIRRRRSSGSGTRRSRTSGSSRSRTASSRRSERRPRLGGAFPLNPPGAVVRTPVRQRGERSGQMRRAATAAFVGVLAVAAAGCGGYGGKSKGTTSGSGSGGGQTVIAGVNANNHGSATVSDEEKVELDDFYFKPTVLKGKPGQRVTLELENEGKEEHNFSIDSQTIDKDLE